uniref:Plastidic ATP/ADP-transporter n=1 Tax=Arundo donax TaxID=35708 RepID=A0A0A9DYG8_ARUDO
MGQPAHGHRLHAALHQSVQRALAGGALLHRHLPLHRLLRRLRLRALPAQECHPSHRARRQASCGARPELPWPRRHIEDLELLLVLCHG